MSLFAVWSVFAMAGGAAALNVISYNEDHTVGCDLCGVLTWDGCDTCEGDRA